MPAWCRASISDQSKWPAVDEITASSIVKIDQQGRGVREADLTVNAAGFTIHSPFTARAKTRAS